MNTLIHWLNYGARQRHVKRVRTFNTLTSCPVGMSGAIAARVGRPLIDADFARLERQRLQGRGGGSDGPLQP